MTDTVINFPLSSFFKLENKDTPVLELGKANTPMYPQTSTRIVTEPNVCELYGDEDELLASFGREGVTVYNPRMEAGDGKTLYLFYTHGLPSLQQWDSFKVMSKAVFGIDLTDRQSPNFMKRSLMERDMEHVEE
jgi:hypothetical protein